MFQIRLSATVEVSGRRSPSGVKIFSAEKLSDVLSHAIAAQDGVALDAITNGPLLADAVVIRWQVVPAVPRDELVTAWITALSENSGVVGVLPEIAEAMGQVSQAVPSVSGDASDPSSAQTSWSSSSKSKKGGRSNG